MPPIQKRLIDLEPGDEGIICRIIDETSEFERIREMGLSDGTAIRVIKLAPLGDPIEIKVRGTYLSIRKSMAEKIYIRKKHYQRRKRHRHHRLL
jgi:ferrous iron transport protein A